MVVIMVPAAVAKASRVAVAVEVAVGNCLGKNKKNVLSSKKTSKKNSRRDSSHKYSHQPIHVLHVLQGQDASLAITCWALMFLVSDPPTWVSTKVRDPKTSSYFLKKKMRCAKRMMLSSINIPKNAYFLRYWCIRALFPEPTCWTKNRVTLQETITYPTRRESRNIIDSKVSFWQGICDVSSLEGTSKYHLKDPYIHAWMLWYISLHLP